MSDPALSADNVTKKPFGDDESKAGSAAFATTVNNEAVGDGRFATSPLVHPLAPQPFNDLVQYVHSYLRLYDCMADFVHGRILLDYVPQK